MKKFLYIIIGIVLLYMILAFIGPSHVKIEKTTSIQKSAELVKKHASDYKFFHDKWSPWTELDPNMKTQYSGNAGEVGHRYEWSGNSDVSKGSMEMTGFNGDSIIQKLSFENRGDTKCYYIVSDDKGATNFTWGLEMDVPFLFRPVMLFTDMGMNKRFETGVSNLKKTMEGMEEEPVVADYKVLEQNWDEVTYIGKKEVVPFDKMTAFFGKNLPAVFEALDKNKIEPQAPPSAIYTMYDEIGQKAEVAAVAKVANHKKLKGYESFTYPSSKVLHIEYYGDYAKIGSAHFAMENYMKEKGLTQKGIIEEYVTDPMNEKDTTRWLTNIYYIVK